MTDTVIPILPSSDLDRTTAFYGRLGFTVVGRYPAPHDYLIVRRGLVELHFVVIPDRVPADSVAACYLRVDHVDAMHGAFGHARLPQDGIPRMSALEDKPWGMREFHVIDPDGTLLRIGQDLPA
ncbi:MAG: VOC family protein [Burkholderiales bacterium]